MEMEGDENQNSFAKHWGWYTAVSKLAEDKVWKINDVVALPLIACLNHLSYIMDVNKEEEKRIKEAYNQR